MKWVPELSSLADSVSERVYVREPWRLASQYQRHRRINIKPRRDSPLWVMSVNRNNWPDYEQMMTGYAWTVSFEPANNNSIHNTKCPSYPPPIVPPVEIEIQYDLIPIDHSWGDGPRVNGINNARSKGKKQGRQAGKKLNGHSTKKKNVL